MRKAAPRPKPGADRMRACKLCTTSMYVAIAGLVAFFLLGGIVGAITGVVALVMGVWGRVSLAALGRNDALERADSTALERVAARMDARARREGVLGAVIGAGLAALWVVLLLGGQFT